MRNETHIEEYVRAALALHELQLDPARQAAVIEQFHLLASMAQSYLNQASADEEAAPIYRL
jgi:hypothetical protein